MVETVPKRSQTPKAPKNHVILKAKKPACGRTGTGILATTEADDVTCKQCLAILKRSLTPAQHKLREDTRMRLRYLTKDSRTFFKVRHDLRQWYNADHGDRPIGGGNFLTGIGLLSALNFAAKVHLHLIDPEAFSTEAHRLAVKSAVKTLDAAHKKIAKGGHTRWEEPRVGGCNEAEAFIKLSQALKPTIDLGLANNEEAGEVWRFFRNALAHMAWPRGMVLVLKSEFSSAEAELRLRGEHRAFRKHAVTKIWSFNVDRLLIEMNEITDWLSEKIELCPYPERVEAAVQWMTKDLMVVPT